MVADNGPMQIFHTKSAVSCYNSHLQDEQCLHCISDQFDVTLMDKKFAFLPKTTTFLSDPKLLNGSVYVYITYLIDFPPFYHYIDEYHFTATLRQRAYT
jgi:hypothetical protein